MKKVAKYYFTHVSIWVYITLLISAMSISFYYGYFFEYWHMLFLPILIAPFFEWVIHKYILHAQIGNVFEVKYQKGKKTGDHLKLMFLNKIKKVEVLKIKGNKMLVGYGWARKMKFIRDHMYVLHYGHHEDPNHIPLVFAPIISVLFLFGFLFGFIFILTLSFGNALVFLIGVIVYYLYYEWMHLGHHIPEYKHVFPWNNRLKTAHQLHHYRNENYWWGITNSLGDIIFGTYRSHKNIEVSENLRNINYK